MPMLGYKGFNKNLTCRGFQYKVGETYEAKGEIALCSNGFHFCRNPNDLEYYYGALDEDRFCEIEASGKILEGMRKCVCSEIRIVREIPREEFLSLINKGDGNTGWSNEGNSNEGNSNEGDWNKGDWNKGDWNEGNWNEGNSNEGDCNIGSYNHGTGLCGIFNTDCGCVIFNKYTKMTHTEIEKMAGYLLLCCLIDIKTKPTDEQLEEIKKLPNFDEKVMNELIFGKEGK